MNLYFCWRYGEKLMNRTPKILMTAALGLIMSALTHTGYSQAGQKTCPNSAFVKPPIPIASLPLTINAPGYYYFISNMYFTPTSMSNNVAIRVNSDAVTVDLNGFSLTGPPQAYIPELYLNPFGVLITNNNVTIKNGTVVGFYTALAAAAPFNGTGDQGYLSNIAIAFISFTGGGPLGFESVNNSIVSHCNFAAPYQPYSAFIHDHGSQTGNRYIDDTFSAINENPIDMDVQVPMVLSMKPQTKGSRN